MTTEMPYDDLLGLVALAVSSNHCAPPCPGCRRDARVALAATLSRVAEHFETMGDAEFEYAGEYIRGHWLPEGDDDGDCC